MLHAVVALASPFLHIGQTNTYAATVHGDKLGSMDGMKNETSARSSLMAALEARFGQRLDIPAEPNDLVTLAGIAGRRSHRRYADRPVDPALVRLLAAIALSAPSKSDLQQADIVICEDPALRRDIADLVPNMPWVRAAPAFLVVLANNRRQRQIAELRGRPFANDHLDAFFNASVDAGILLAFLVNAAEAAGLGCCPISVIRDRSEEISALLGLPDHVFPVAGLCLGWPAEEGAVSPRLPLSATVHVDRFRDETIAEDIAGYDARRNRTQPYATQRATDRFGTSDDYGWSEDKARQYASAQREDFGAFIRKKGFRLD